MDFEMLVQVLVVYDATDAFTSLWSFITRVWTWVFNMLKSIEIGGVSLLFINISLTIFGLIFTVFFAVVRSGVSSSMGVGSSVRAERRRQKDDDKNGYNRYERDRWKRESYQRIYEERNNHD